MFQTSFLLRNPHVQTLFATFFRKDKLEKVETEEFILPDGDFVECVWQKEKPKDHRPIVVLFHGLAGSVNSPYIIGLMNALDKQGFALVLMHFRGCGKKENLKPRAYHSGETGDAKAFIEHLQKTYPNNPLHAVGFSIGGNMLLKLLAEWGSDAPLHSAVSVSAPLSLDICADTIEKGFARVYQNYLLTPLKATLLQKYKKFEMEKYIGSNEEEIKSLKTIRAFDDAYIAPMFGFNSSQDYYDQCSARQYLKDIKTRTLIIHAKDDPFMTEEIIPNEEELSDFVMLELSEHGGHVGFVSGTLREPVYWLDERVLEFLLKQNPINQKQEELKVLVGIAPKGSLKDLDMKSIRASRALDE
ncbi:MAG: Hydrolase, alpha/beta fold family functionally coupled to Phosphoribulokinase [uncultured Sulfurovum sp.]|uniref:Hydrolase, alpha/beta fold family functionally coupled to Phosphoribulokinase n=1 Tax=uncultured Sulfurovum sp. TaxID=269237 RepID=A0A6S6SMW1_9BACT|nr:MAG: Hydrolase, alpha/beta fold family functionally coupled to Phosphoribulokinase [uncultured Sulfurovum sp.]